LKNIYKNSYIGCCMGFRKSILAEALPFPRKIPMHDMWLGIVAELCGNVIFIDEKLIRYRWHENNFTQKKMGASEAFANSIKYRYYLFFAILKKIWKRFGNGF